MIDDAIDPMGAYYQDNPEEPVDGPRFTECLVCGKPGERYKPPRDEFWSHLKHPEDEHDFQPWTPSTVTREQVERAARYMFENRTVELDQSPDEEDEWETLPWRDEWIEGATLAAEGFGFTVVTP